MNDTNIKIDIESKLSNLPFLRKMVRGLCSCVIEEESVFQDIDLCLNEALSNVIQHAYQNEPGHLIEIIVTISQSEFVFQIQDAGLNNLREPILTSTDALPNTDIKDLNSLSESGRGLYIIHQLMDEVVYKRENGKNILLMRKRF